MKELMVTGVSLPEAYHLALLGLNESGEVVDCADWKTTAKEVSMTMVVMSPLVEPAISKCFIGGPRELEQYILEITEGILDFEVDRGNWAYTYHRRFADQIDFVVEDLKRNPSSRRAVMLVRDNGEDMGSDDPACLQHIQYILRDGRLHCKVLFRSNDAVKATFMNAFALIRLQKIIADKLGVEVGSYTHRANSFHCYAKDFSLLDRYVDAIVSDPNPYGPTFTYTDEWECLMEDEKEDILKMVEELKNRPV